MPKKNPEQLIVKLGKKSCVTRKTKNILEGGQAERTRQVDTTEKGSSSKERQGQEKGEEGVKQNTPETDKDRYRFQYSTNSEMFLSKKTEQNVTAAVRAKMPC